MTTENLTHLSKIIRARHSELVSFDPQRAPCESDLREGVNPLVAGSSPAAPRNSPTSRWEILA